MKRLLLSLVSAELLEAIGLWLIIAGLIGEASLVFSWVETALEKPLTFVFTIVIALGVWIENVGASNISSEKDARIAEANARALEAQLALEKFKAPRSLSEEKRERIGARLVPFAGQLFTINTYWNDSEPTNFAKAIGEGALISGAHWQYVRPTGFLVGRVIGLTVDVAGDADEKTKGAAAALVSALKNADVDAMLSHDQTDKTIVSITVGLKP